MKNIDKRIKYIIFNLFQMKFFVFIDGLFMNKDFNSQIRYLIALVNEIPGNDYFKLSENLIYYNSIKSKRITRSILASEIYGMVRGVDIAIAINIIIRIITE